MSSEMEAAVKILKKTFWSAKGWRDKRTISKEDLAFATKAGVMFPPEHLPHDKVLHELSRLIETITPTDVGNAFLASLSTRQVASRSALASYQVALELGVHQFSPNRHHPHCCEVCGQAKNSRAKEDLNVLSFERHMWGGVRHRDPVYHYVDLRCFAAMPKAVPVEQDCELFKQLLAAIVHLPPNSWASGLVKALTGIIPGNKDELRTLIEILGYAGVLAVPKDAESEKDRRYRDTDWSGPAEIWKAKDGYNADAIKRFFPAIVL